MELAAMSTDTAVDLSNPCSHVSDIKIREVERPGKACVDCIKIHGHWLHLRECLICGHIACCDSSPNKHATKHFHGTGHPVMRSIEPGESWGWCFVDEVMVESVD